MPDSSVPEPGIERRFAEAARTSIRDGSFSVFLTLALCMALPFGGIGIVAVASVLSIATSRGKLVGEAIRLYFGPWLKSDAFRLNLLILVVTLVELGLILHHGDDSGDLENQVKQYVAALAVLLTIRRFPVGIVLWGAAVGCLLAGLVALHDLFVLDLPRAEGPTNPIRFGMLAALLAMFAWSGALFWHTDLRTRIFLLAATFAGVFALFASGSRGAVLALPAMLLLLIPRFWQHSRARALLAALVFILFSVALGLWQANTIRANLSNLVQAAGTVVSGEAVEEKSARNRVEMLRLAGRLFLAHPIAGVGARGWDEGVAEQRRTSPPETALDEAFNQPHNQYANDFAKGGLLRGLGGLAMLLLPLWYFLKRRPFRFHEKAMAPLLGVITCVAFIVFGLTESVMDLSLTSSIYAILVFYLIASAEGPPLSTGRPEGAN
jgi:O-antigen ligase